MFQGLLLVQSEVTRTSTTAMSEKRTSFMLMPQNRKLCYRACFIDMLTEHANQEEIRGQEHTGYSLKIQALD